jgi:hypothetical protein
MVDTAESVLFWCSRKLASLAIRHLIVTLTTRRTVDRQFKNGKKKMKCFKTLDCIHVAPNSYGFPSGKNLL